MTSEQLQPSKSGLKPPLKVSSYLLLLLLTLLAGPVAAAPHSTKLEQNFLHPPDQFRPWVFWFWLNGNVTSKGITADLEAMQRVGIGGVAIMDVDQGTPKGPAVFGSTAWLGLFKHTCAEAQRLGLKVDMNDDAGWSGSGGPWITPELSMQKIVWSETSIQGPTRFEGLLEWPKSERNFYRDIAVIAFPTPAGDTGRMADASPKVTASTMDADFDPKKIMDGDPKTFVYLPRPEAGDRQFIQLEFRQPYNARTLLLSMTGLAQFQSCHGAVQVSEDGQNFRNLHEFDAENAPLVLNFEPVAARFFRVLFTSADVVVQKLGIVEVELSSKFRIDNVEAKSLLVAGKEPTEKTNRFVLPPGCAIDPARILNITPRMDKDGWLTWDVPAGNWTILRFGHTSTGKDNHPAPELGRGLECDKLSKKAIEVMFEGFMARLTAAVGPLAGHSLVATHVDSWEVLSQNWTPKFREEFRRLRGYDLFPYLPTVAGRVVGSLDISERFLRDLRQTVSDLLVENYAGHLSELAHKKGLYLTTEAYGGNPCDDLVYGSRVDQPVAEFWSWPPYTMAYSIIEMASVAHLYGKPIIGAEACTATDAEKWLADPYWAKVFSDWGFCMGVNHFILHRYAQQPWTNPPRVPGMSMGPWGLHYERTQTWWEQSVAFNHYLARCEYLLQQGLFNADICYVEPEDPPEQWLQPGRARERPNYNFDVCPAEVVLDRMSVADGRLLVKGGMSYRLLALSDSKTITPPLLSKIRNLVAQGATLVGPKPLNSPSLTDFPNCDLQVRRKADELWGNADGKTVFEHRFGKGRVVWGKSPPEVLAADGVSPDFMAQTTTRPQSLRYIHRIVGESDLYFVANKYPLPEEAVCAFRVKGTRPELWYPDTGRIERTAIYQTVADTVRMPLHLDPFGSVFVRFHREQSPESDRIVKLTRNGESVFDATAFRPQEPVAQTNDMANTFTIAVWAKPEVETDLLTETNSGISALHNFHNDALFPPPGHELFPGVTNSCCGLAVGRNGVCVLEHADGYFCPPLVYPTPVTNWTHIAIVYRDNKPSLYLNGKPVHEGMQSHFTVHAGVGLRHRHGVAPFRGELSEFNKLDHALTEAELADLMKSMPVPNTPSTTPIIELRREAGIAQHPLSSPTKHQPGSEALPYHAEVWQPGAYVATTAQGKNLRFEIPSLPEPCELSGPWDLSFPPNLGPPEHVRLDQLISWSDHPQTGIKYFSGTATYNKTFQLPPGLRAQDQRVYLDLGKVAVIAQIKLNGTDLGTFWKPPFRADVTETVRPGENVLEIKVVNLWVNRMIGDEQLPEDSDRKADGTLNVWPLWLRDNQPNPSGRYTFTTWRLWQKDSSLRESGLIGPVRLFASKELALQ